MKHLLVSGGTGLAGRYIVEECLAAGHKVTVAGRRAPADGLFSPAVGYRPLDLAAGKPDGALFDGIDVFVHAAFSHVPGRYRGGEGDDPAGFLRLNVDGSVALFEAARQAGVRHCLFLSSRAVFDGYPAGTALSETLAPEPASLYGKAKLEAEKALAALAAPGFVPASLRATGIYGDLYPNKWESLFSDYLEGRTISPRAGSELHGRDLAGGVLAVLGAHIPKVSGKALNVSDIVVDNHTILAPLKAALASPHPLPARADHDQVSVMATSRLNALGWRTGGMPLFSATLQTLVEGFLARHPGS
ncbi:NAD-dependent epimerase/dehydratase family protein [Martelella radicis]|uniref:Nucleoside-diphosphate-sugar epimerase n=1 Tax=Martelella radicis TaxID=1397476 RepID=A0A7W6KJG8_9HYPH|nr:NAD(P)-dependent oxidoreductase [Martelella radicis]MBB4122237.1 nucleoside-diphosphate-sugar epimerase [Martelella radicis]